MQWILPKKNNLSIIDQLYSTRNITDRDKFNNPSMNDLYSPLLLNDIEKAVSIIKDYISKKKRIFIHGDFDVDGISATSLLWRFLYKELNADALPYVPNRFTEGYGLSEESIKAIIDQGGELIITVDCGIKDIELVHKYSNKINFIITDHHSLNESGKDTNIEYTKEVNSYLIAKDALAVIHPRLNDYPFKELCGAGVAWKLCCALNTILDLGINMKKYIDLAALGTVCDVMPLIDENRVIVKLGIDQMKITENIGIKTFIEELKIKRDEISTYHIGFIIGPRLNASGRMDKAIEAVRLLSTDSANLSKSILLKLNNLNLDRQNLTQQYLIEAEKQIKKQISNKIYLVYGDNWPEGIIGLIAGKLTEKYSRPIIVGSKKNDIVKSSARSIEAFNMAENLSGISNNLISYGGHSQAAGLTFKFDKLDLIEKYLINIAFIKIKDEDLEKKVYIDVVLEEENLLEISKSISIFHPFGEGNLKPRFAILGCNIINYKFIGKTNHHVKFKVKNDYLEIECIKFNTDNEFKNFIVTNSFAVFDLVGSLEIETWNGTGKAMFFVEDIRFKSIQN